MSHSLSELQELAEKALVFWPSKEEEPTTTTLQDGDYFVTENDEVFRLKDGAWHAVTEKGTRDWVLDVARPSRKSSAGL